MPKSKEKKKENSLDSQKKKRKNSALVTRIHYTKHWFTLNKEIVNGCQKKILKYQCIKNKIKTTILSTLSSHLQI